MTMPLDGVRVVDWTIWQQGPVCSAILGDLGADVIKVEERTGGDPGRGFVRSAGRDLTAVPNFYFEANNRNKRGITVDLKSAEGREIVQRLVERSDVFVQNFRPGVAERLGVGYDELRARNPRLVYASGSGFGPKGPDAGAPAFDILGVARSGMMYAPGDQGMPPLAVGGGIADQMGATMLAFGVVSALLQRERTGAGARVDASLLSGLLFLQGLSVSARLMLGSSISRPPAGRVSSPFWNHYRCKDDKWIALGMMSIVRFWEPVCRAIGATALLEDPRFADGDSRRENMDEIVRIISETFATRTRDEWLDVLRAEPDFIVGPVNSLDDVHDDPQVKANGYVVDADHPVHGQVQMVGLPFSLDRDPFPVRRTAPEFGQHTEEVLTELLGYGWDDIERFKDREVI